MQQFLYSVLAAAGGGAIGAALRFSVLHLALPGAVGVFALNAVGALVLGFAGSALEGRSDLVVIFIGAGFCGGLTTFSTFAADAVRLAASAPLQAALYVLGSVAVAIAMFGLGTLLGRVL